jgi:hypothetical protein
MKKQRGVAFLMGSAISATTMGVYSKILFYQRKIITFVSFSATDEQILSEFAETIIPTTASSGGAKAGNRVHLFL